MSYKWHLADLQHLTSRAMDARSPWWLGGRASKYAGSGNERKYAGDAASLVAVALATMTWYLHQSSVQTVKRLIGKGYKASPCGLGVTEHGVVAELVHGFARGRVGPACVAF